MEGMGGGCLLAWETTMPAAMFWPCLFKGLSTMKNNRKLSYEIVGNFLEMAKVWIS